MKENGWIKLQDMKMFGLETTIWFSSRAPVDDQDLYLMGRLSKKDWLSTAIVKIIQTFNLSEFDVLSIRNTFDDILGTAVQESIRIADLHRHFVSSFIICRIVSLLTQFLF